MDLNFTDEERAFREEARRFFRTAIPETIRAKVAEGEGLTRDDMILSQRTLNQHGWATPNWPVEWGGKAWSPVQVYLYQDEMQQANVPAPIPFNVSMVGPVIAQFASQEVKQRFPADDRERGYFLVPGVFRTRVRVRSRLVAYAGGARGR